MGLVQKSWARDHSDNMKCPVCQKPCIEIHNFEKPLNKIQGFVVHETEQIGAYLKIKKKCDIVIK